MDVKNHDVLSYDKLEVLSIHIYSSYTECQ